LVQTYEVRETGGSKCYISIKLQPGPGNVFGVYLHHEMLGERKGEREDRWEKQNKTG
jgi:hypothetical protein